MSLIGKTIVVRGEVRATDALTIQGRIEGPVFCEGGEIVVEPGGSVAGDVIARDITIFGRMAGQLVATDVVDVRAQAEVTGHVVSPRFILDGDGVFEGRVEPQHLEAALRVAKFQQKKRSVG